MLRFLRQSRTFPGCRQFLHTIKLRELDQPAYHKKPLDPGIVALIKEYDADIFYTSYVELNKKSLSLDQRMEIMGNKSKTDFRTRLNEARESEPSILIEKLVKFSDAKSNDNASSVEVGSSEEPKTVIGDPVKIQNEEQRLELAKSKLKILTEMGLRRSAIEYEMQSAPDNWMEDYETYDEIDFSADTHYGTPGIYLSDLNFVFKKKINYSFF